MLDARRSGADVDVARATPLRTARSIYDFSPSAKELLDELLPLTVKTALFQAFLDADDQRARRPHGRDEERHRQRRQDGQGR